MNEIVSYIETHPQLIKLLIFIAGVTIAWFTGALKAIKGLSDKLENKIRVNINKTTATITILNEFKHNNLHDAQRFAFWLSVTIQNPTEKTQTISGFELKFKNKRNRWSDTLAAVTFPSIPRMTVGDNIKYLPVYYTHFVEAEALFGKEFTPTGRLNSGESQNGYLLFVEEMFGNWLPHITTKGVKIQITCRDLRDRKYKSTGWAKTLSEDKTYDIIPGLKNYKESSKYLSSLSRWEESIDPQSKLGKDIMKVIDQIDSNENA
ncbi:MAG: hypothetical protein U0586_16125 [Candidatus Brocadiaceae bacterium]